MSPYVAFQSDTHSVWDALCSAHGNLAFDIGANGGLVASKLAENFETVIACEPAWESFEQLKDSVPSNVRPLMTAVSDHAGEIELRETTLTGHWGELFTGDTLPWGGHVGYRKVFALTLDELSEEYGFPDFIKIDTEGHEVQVMRGGTKTFETGPAFVIEVHSALKGEDVRAMLTSFGLTYQIHLHHAYKPTSPHRLEHYWVTSP